MTANYGLITVEPLSAHQLNASLNCHLDSVLITSCLIIPQVLKTTMNKLGTKNNATTTTTTTNSNTFNL